MPRSKPGFWIVMALAIVVPTVMAFVLIRVGGFAGVALLAVLVGAFVVARIAFARRFTPDLQPRRQPPPERELIAHARRPTMMIGLGILVVTLALMLGIGLFGSDGSRSAAVTPTPDLSPRGTDVTPIVSEPSGLLAGFALPIAAAVLGTIGLVVLIVATRRANHLVLVPRDDDPAISPDAARPDESIDWAEMLDGDDDSDLSLWVDSLSRNDRKR